MDNDNIVPDVVDNLPSAVLNVKYPNGKQVNFGKELTPTEVKDEPTITWQTEPNKYYLLVMTDPDPAPEIKEVKHWLIGNIKGNDLSTGEIFAEYLGSGPQKELDCIDTYFLFMSNQIK
ncbi:hypothetical protein WA026_010597 [Henosepilachna vigintioctopunctata]|uniref:Phosphatidylethanolamine-binding protein n=1 Tax=Henosepilachna vigintioctopunctata TaxID=420089 RepID=A0AAW1VDP1_9CUCU